MQVLSATLLAAASNGQAALAEESTNPEVQVCSWKTIVLLFSSPADLATHSVLAYVQFKTLSYPTLAFEFQYPVATTTGRKLPVIISRKPERYSSAAPLTADARQRIVTELVDFPDGITISVSVWHKPNNDCHACVQLCN